MVLACTQNTPTTHTHTHTHVRTRCRQGRHHMNPGLPRRGCAFIGASVHTKHTHHTHAHTHTYAHAAGREGTTWDLDYHAEIVPLLVQACTQNTLTTHTHTHVRTRCRQGRHHMGLGLPRTGCAFFGANVHTKRTPHTCTRTHTYTHVHTLTPQAGKAPHGPWTTTQKMCHYRCWQAMPAFEKSLLSP